MISMPVASLPWQVNKELKIERRCHINDFCSGPGTYLLKPRTFKLVALQTNGHDIYQSALVIVRF